MAFSKRSSSLADFVLLYVEDDDAAAYLFQLALGRSKMSPQFFRVSSGEQATAFLTRKGSFVDAPRPNLVLLDLNLPCKSSFDVLAEIRRDPDLRGMTVIAFSSSLLPFDRDKSMELGADEYKPKSLTFQDLVDFAKGLVKETTNDNDLSWLRLTLAKNKLDEFVFGYTLRCARVAPDGLKDHESTLFAYRDVVLRLSDTQMFTAALPETLVIQQSIGDTSPNRSQRTNASDETFL